MENIQKFISQILYLDTETTSLDQKTSEIIELGGYEPAIDQQAWGSLYGAVVPPTPEASSVNHISKRMIADKPLFINSLHETLIPRIQNKHHFFVAHNEKFDRAVLTRAFEQANEDISIIGNRDNWICTWRLCQHIIPSMTVYKLDYLRYALDLDTDNYGAHRATADVMVTHELMLYLISQAFASGMLNDESDIGVEFVKLTQQSVLFKKWPFGKHANQPLEEIPTKYFEWAILNMDSLQEGNLNYNADLAASVVNELNRREL